MNRKSLVYWTKDGVINIKIYFYFSRKDQLHSTQCIAFSFDHIPRIWYYFRSKWHVSTISPCYLYIFFNGFQWWPVFFVSSFLSKHREGMSEIENECVTCVCTCTLGTCISPLIRIRIIIYVEDPNQWTSVTNKIRAEMCSFVLDNSYRVQAI